ncbi:MAG: hypothetical protein ACXVDA_17315 [Ktedonobacterales bacterium]
MQKVTEFLHLASQGLALCAVLAGLAAGFLEAVVGATLICVDTCSSRDDYFSHLGADVARVMTPCVVLEGLALAAFLAYCLATRQARRALTPVLFFLVGGLIGVAALNALLQYGQATVPVGEEGFLIAASAETWAWLWGLALLLVAGAWSGVLAYLQWAAE